MPVTDPNSQYECGRYGYSLPEMPFIPAAGHQELYRLEEQIGNKIYDAVPHMIKAIGGDNRKLALAEVLASVLSSQETRAADAAAIAYLLQRGYGITDRTTL